MKRLSPILTLVFIITACVSAEVRPYSADLDRLDEALERADEYVGIKEQKISTIENMLHSRGVTPLQQYHIYGELYKEYLPFQFDKAKEMLENQERLAEEMGNVSMRYDAMLDKAMILTMAGFFLEAEQVFEKLDTSAFDAAQKVSWYNVRQKFLHDYNEYVRTSSFAVPDAGKIAFYQDKVLEGTPEDSNLNRHMRILRMIERREFERAYDENMAFIESLSPEEHDYAVQTYWQGFICENLERPDEVISQMADSTHQCITSSGRSRFSHMNPCQ